MGQVGNPYPHNPLNGHFQGPMGGVSLSGKLIREYALDAAEEWQRNNSEIMPEYDENGTPYLRGGDLDGAISDEKNAKASEYESEVKDVFDSYNKEMCKKVWDMDYETLKDYCEHPEKYDKEVVEKVAGDSGLPNSDRIAERASEEFYESNVIDGRFKRIVSRCNGHMKLFAMADDDFDGFSENFAAQAIKERGLEQKYKNYKLAKKAYANGEQALGKKADEYKDEKSYIRAKMKFYSQIDNESHYIIKEDGSYGLTASGEVQEGMIVEYSPKWRSPGEEKYVHVIKEFRSNPVTGDPKGRVLISTINSGIALGSESVVDVEMIRPADKAKVDNVFAMPWETEKKYKNNKNGKLMWLSDHPESKYNDPDFISGIKRIEHLSDMGVSAERRGHEFAKLCNRFGISQMEGRHFIQPEFLV